jgi:hypothetical protein
MGMHHGLFLLYNLLQPVGLSRACGNRALRRVQYPHIQDRFAGGGSRRIGRAQMDSCHRTGQEHHCPKEPRKIERFTTENQTTHSGGLACLLPNLKPVSEPAALEILPYFSSADRKDHDFAFFKACPLYFPYEPAQA